MAQVEFDPDDIRHTLLALQDLPIAVARIEERQSADAKEIKDDLKEVKAHVKVTNGRVSKLELWKARMEGSHATASWLTNTVIALFASGIGGVVVYFLSK